MSTIKSGLNTDVRGQTVIANGRPYFTNDFDPVQVWNPPSASTDAAGISAPSGAIGTPSQAAGSNTTAGDHLVRYRYLNKRTGYISDPSDAITVTVTATGTDGQITFGVAASGDDIDRSTDAKVTHIVVEMTAVGGSTYYDAVVISNSGVSSAVVDISDSTLIQGNSYQTLYGSFGHEPPPICRTMTYHGGIMFYGGATVRTRTAVTATNASTTVTGTNFSTDWVGRYIRFDSENATYRIDSVSSSTSLELEDNYTGTTSSDKVAVVFSPEPNKYFWSASGLPESTKQAERARFALEDKSDRLLAIASYAGDVWFFGDHSIERLSYTTDPALGTVIDVPTEFGVWNSHVLVGVGNRLYGFCRAGFWVLGGGIPQYISNPIDETVNDLIDRAQDNDFHGAYDPVQRVIRWWFTATGDTTPHHAAVYDIDNGEWWIDTYDIGITASSTVPDSNGKLRCMIGDENGYSWFHDGGLSDGVASNNPTVVTANGTPTTTVIDVDETLSSSIAALDGAPVYVPSTGETSYVSSHTTSQITLGTALSTAPSAGDKLYLGSFEWKIKTKWFTGRGSELKKSSSGILIKLVPSTDTDATVTVKMYFDYSTTAYTFDVGSGSYTFDNGITVTDGQDSLTFALADAVNIADSNGLIRIPMPAIWWRSCQVELIMRDPRGSARFLDLQVVDDLNRYDDEE